MSPDPVDLLRLAASRLDGRQNTKHAQHPHVIRNTLFPHARLWDRATDIFSTLNHLSSLPVSLASPFAEKSNAASSSHWPPFPRDLSGAQRCVPKSHTAAPTHNYGS